MEKSSFVPTKQIEDEFIEYFQRMDIIERENALKKLKIFYLQVDVLQQ